MLRKLLIGTIGFISVTFASTQDPLNFVFMVDGNYLPHCAETIYTMQVAMPNANKNIIVLMPDLKNIQNELTPLSDDHTRIFPIDIHDINCINWEAMKKYKTEWSSLIHLRWQLVSIMTELNTKQELVAQFFDRKPISSFMSLDSDLWILDDVSNIFNIVNPWRQIFSAPLSPISVNNYEAIILECESNPIKMGVSSGVLLFLLDEIENPAKFTEKILEKLEDAWNEHNLLRSELFYSMTVYFLKQDETSKELIRCFLKEFLEKVGNIPIEKSSYESIIEILGRTKTTETVSEEFINCMKEIIRKTAAIDWNFENTFNCNSLFNFLLMHTLEQINVETFKNDFKKAQQMFPADESALNHYTDVETLSRKYNFNPKDLFPNFSVGNEAGSAYPKFAEVRRLLLLNEAIRTEVYRSASDISILHFDGTGKPWDNKRLSEIVEIDPQIAKIQEFYDKVRNRTLTSGNLKEFKAFLAAIALSRVICATTLPAISYNG